MQTVELTPLLRQSIGFDRFNELFESALNNNAYNDQNTHPQYNIEKTGENSYRILMALAGFSIEELNIVTLEDELTISGKPSKSTDDVELLHKGITHDSFEKKFSLSDYMKVTGATFDNGLLEVTLEREIPESRKARAIEITPESSAKNKLLTSNKKIKKTN